MLEHIQRLGLQRHSTYSILVENQGFDQVFDKFMQICDQLATFWGGRPVAAANMRNRKHFAWIAFRQRDRWACNLHAARTLLASGHQ